MARSSEPSMLRPAVERASGTARTRSWFFRNRLREGKVATRGKKHADSGGASRFPGAQWLPSFSREMRVHRCHARARPNALTSRRWRVGRLTHSPRGARGLWQATVDMQSAPPASWSSHDEQRTPVPPEGAPTHSSCPMRGAHLHAINSACAHFGPATCPRSLM